MSSRATANNNENLISLAQEIAKGSYLLMEQEMTIFRVELQKEWRETKRTLPILFLAGVAVVIVGLLTSLAVVEWLVQYRRLSLWVGYGIVASGGFMFATILCVIGARRLNSLSLLPRETLQSFKENIQCLTK